MPSASPSAVALVNVDSTAGEKRCLAQRGGDEQLEAEYDTTAGAVDAWVQRLRPGDTAAQLPLYAVSPSRLVYFCYLRSPGGYAIPYPAPLFGHSPTPEPNQRVVAVDGNGVAYTLTYWDGPIARPAMPTSSPTSSRAFHG